MSEEKDFFKTCFNTVASLDVKNESQAIAKEVVLSEVERLQQENKQLKEKLDYDLQWDFKYDKQVGNWNKLKEYISIKLYNTEYLQKLCGCRIDDIDHILLNAIRKEMQELEQGSDNDE